MRVVWSFRAESALRLSAVDKEWGGGNCLYCSHSTIEGKQRDNPKREFAVYRDASDYCHWPKDVVVQDQAGAPWPF
jgi:hypothetical protein